MPLPRSAVRRSRGRLTERLRLSCKAGRVVWAIGFVVLFVLSLASLVHNAYTPFLYAQF